ncbi:MAG: NUDIX hydrolase [Verrucomicrobiota bacterium]
MADGDTIEYEGRHLLFGRKANGWEYVSRRYARGVVGVLGLDQRRQVLLVEQWRFPVGQSVFELPAGLAGDEPGREDEPLVTAAKREFLEETGCEAAQWISLGEGCTGAGMTDEKVTLFLACGIQQIRDQSVYGMGRESIRVHRVPLPEVIPFLQDRQEEGASIDFKIFAALYLARQHPAFESDIS